MYTTLLFPFFALSQRVLEEEPIILEKLRPHAGKIVAIYFKTYSIRFKILEGGYIEKTSIMTPPDANIMIQSEHIIALIQKKEAPHTYVRLEGDAALLEVISILLKEWRFDGTHYMSRLLGNTLGHHWAQFVSHALQTIQANTIQLAQASVEYFVEEKEMLIKPENMTQLSQMLSRLEDEIERLNKRISRCEKGLNNGM